MGKKKIDLLLKKMLKRVERLQKKNNRDIKNRQKYMR